MSLERHRLVALLLVPTLVAAACTGGDDPEDPTAPATPGITAPGPGSSPSPIPSVIFEPSDDVLEVAITEPATLDPMRIGDPGSVLVARQLYESLTGWDPVEEVVYPAAAEGWKVSNGGRRFTFSLRPGATFHDDRPVRAQDFVYAFNRMAREKSGSDLAYTLERIEGFVEVNQLGSADTLAGVRAKDDLTLEIDLVEPFYDLPALLTHPGLVPLRKDVVNDDRFVTAPIGNGPFEMAEPWGPGQPVVLKRFDGFIRTPSLEGVIFTPFPDSASSWLRFLGGEFDLAEVPADQIEAAAEAFGDEGFQPLLAGYYYGFNLDDEALRNKRLRMAINRGIDREFIAQRIYRGTLEAPRGVVPRGMPGFRFDVCADLCSHDPPAARRLVRTIPRSERKVTLESTRGAPHGRLARAVAANLESIGLRVTVRSFSFKRYLQRLKDGEQQIYRLGWIAEYPVPDAFLSALFRSDSPDNRSGFASAQVDRLLDRANSEAAPGRRQQLFVKAEQAIMRQAPIVPIGSFLTHWARQSYVEDILFDGMGGFDAVGVSIGEGKPEKE